jgi:hypothetical protein
MPTVTVPAEFFRAELRVYSDWRDAFARELLQNATDAAATRIDVTFEDVDGHGRVRFADDGTGMTRRTLEEVFFALGRTTKDGEDSIGGFGRARIILCFAQAGYTIRTGRLLVRGQGGDYTITEVAEHRRGCEFVIDLIDADSSRVRTAMQGLLARCSLKVPTYIDGQRIWGRSMPDRATRVLRDAQDRPWARVYVDRGGYGQLAVRVHGLMMFRRWMHADDDVVVELIPARSREVLSASRDSLRDEFAEEIDRFVADLIRNRSRALRPPTAPLNLRINGGGFLRTDSRRLTDAEITSPAPAVEAADQAGQETEPVAAEPVAADGAATVVAIQPANAAALHNIRAVAAAGARRPGPGGALGSPPRPTNDLGFDVYLLADENDARVRRLARTWNPDNWEPGTNRRRRQLLFAWKAAVEAALDALMAIRPDMSVLWTVGWTFDEEPEQPTADTLAAHVSAGDGHVLALNPVTADGTMRYQVSKRESRQALLAAALHEVAHVEIDGHDNAYADLLTALFAAANVDAADRAVAAAARTA